MQAHPCHLKSLCRQLRVYFLSHAHSAEEAQFKSAVQREKSAFDEALERDLAEADAVMPKETRRLAQAEMLRAVRA